ncbi:MAG: two-component system sensor histidine kinase [Marmoricola sp.]
MLDGRGEGSPERVGTPLAQPPLDAALEEVLQRVEGILDDQERWRVLLDAVVTMAADLSVDQLLGRIVRIAANLSGARYAALGVLDERHPELRLFITHGLDESAAEAIGARPKGHGLLGLIIEHPEPVRLHDIAAHPASYGFPPNHPPMTSFLGVPVRTRGSVFGNLYLTEKVDGEDFTEKDEQIVIALAAAAGVAIENARLHEEAVRRESWLTATAEITAVLTRSRVASDALRVIADRARSLSAADVAWIVAGEDNELALEAVSGAEVDPARAAQLDLSDSLAMSVAHSGEPAMVEDFSTDPHVLDLAAHLGWPSLGPVLMVPLRTRSGTSGVLALGWTHANGRAATELDPALPRMFAEQTALALEVVRSRRDEQRLALFEDRDRIARDLHDLVIQRLFALGLSLQAGIRGDLDAAGQAKIDNVVDELDATIREIRGTIFALNTSERSGSDVQTEVLRIIDRSANTLSFRPQFRLDGPLRTGVPPAVAGDMLAVLAELLSNAARHAHPSRVEVQIDVGSRLLLQVTDDGIGIGHDSRRSGLANVAARAERWGGNCRITPGKPTGTCVTWTVPLETMASRGLSL